VRAAQRLLEASALSVEEVGARCGFGGAIGLRQHFSRVVGTSPTAYRRAFAAA
jgi:transcriptional regulator GlxA family with amidase domain